MNVIRFKVKSLNTISVCFHMIHQVLNSTALLPIFLYARLTDGIDIISPILSAPVGPIWLIPYMLRSQRTTLLQPAKQATPSGDAQNPCNVKCKKFSLCNMHIEVV